MNKIAKVRKLSVFSEIKEDLDYWLSRPPEERIAAVEFLRSNLNGSSSRLQRVFKIVKRK